MDTPTTTTIVPEPASGPVPPVPGPNPAAQSQTICHRWEHFKVNFDDLRHRIVYWANWVISAAAGLDYMAIKGNLGQLQGVFPDHFLALAAAALSSMNFVSHNVLKPPRAT